MDFKTLKKSVSQQLKQSDSQPVETDKNLPSAEALIMLPLTVATVTFFISFVYTQNLLSCFYIGLFIFGFIFLLVYSISTEVTNQNLGNANKLLLDYFVAHSRSVQYIDKNILINKNVFVRANKSISFEKKMELYAAEASIANFQTTLLEYQKGLLISFNFKDSMEHNLYLASKNMQSDFLNLPQVQNFGYFPNLNKAYNIYTDFRGETAAFIEKNELIFTEIAKLTSQNIVLAFLGDEIYLYCQIFLINVLTNHDSYVDLDSKDFEYSFYQLQQIYKILQLLSKVQ